MTPETFDFIDELTEQARSLGLEVLVEVHSYFHKQIEIGRGSIGSTTSRCRRWSCTRCSPGTAHRCCAGSTSDRATPSRSSTPTTGSWIVDVGADSTDKALTGLLGPDDIDRLVERIHDNSAGTSRRATGAVASNVDLYQVNCTFYDALGRDDARYLLARLLQFFTPGIPQVYYVGLLAGSNDMDLLARTGVGRDVNRHHYTRAELVQELDRPVVQALLRLIRFRNAHPAFHGDFSASGEGRCSRCGGAEVRRRPCSRRTCWRAPTPSPTPSTGHAGRRPMSPS